jgi:hypothetical protein
MAKGDGWVYVLTNEAMPGLVKVGRTSKTPEIRAQELSSETSVPGPFVVAYAAYASNHEQAEKVVHRKLRSEGLHANKEFFKCDPWIAIECIRENVDVKYEDCDEEYEEEHEEGTINYEGGDTYVGEYKITVDGLKCRHGQGTYAWLDGRKYVGEWKDDEYNGQGARTYSNGEEYVGEWKDGKKHGHGTYTYSNGERYVGEWKDDKQHGYGTYTWPDGEKHVGEWRDGKKHGHGTYTCSNGEKYVGNFYEDKIHGDLVKTDRNGKVTKHLYRYGRHQKEYGLVGFIRGLME